jgi:hypothetical protein
LARHKSRPIRCALRCSPLIDQSARCTAGVAELCAGRTGVGPVLLGCATARPAQMPATPTLHQLGAGSLFQMALSPPDYKYPFTYLREDKVAIQIISLPSLSPPFKSIQSLRISHSTHSNPNPFGRKIEETPIYISTKPIFIPPCVHRVLLVTLGFVGNPRRLGSPGGIRLVIR